MTELPISIEPGRTATLIWYEAVHTGPDGVAVYQVAGPVLDQAPASPYFLLAPLEQGEFADRLYGGDVGLPELRGFLDRCRLAEGWMSAALDTVFTRAETPALPVLEEWQALDDRPLAPYHADIEAFLCGDLPVHVSPEAYAAAQQVRERFATAWVCAGCGEAEDAGVFLWTVHRDHRVRVCFLIDNAGGRWTCHLHPFEFERVADGTVAGR
jgi:hypothetical protein